MKLDPRRWLGWGAPPEPPDPAVDALQERIARAYDPSAETLERVRENVLHAYAAADLAPAGPGAPARVPRRLLAPAGVALAVVLLAGGLVAAESGPGQPFYGLRLAAEGFTLPPIGTQARVTAELDRLQNRISEVRTAADAGNESAVAAALRAYLEELQTLRTDTSPGSTALVQAALATHELTLKDLAALVPAAAQAALTKALDETGRWANASPGPGTSPGATPGHPGTPPASLPPHPTAPPASSPPSPPEPSQRPPHSPGQP